MPVDEVKLLTAARGTVYLQVTAEARPIDRSSTSGGAQPQTVESPVAFNGTATELLIRRTVLGAGPGSCEKWLKVLARAA